MNPTVQTSIRTNDGMTMLMPFVICSMMAPPMYALSKSVPKMLVLGNKNKRAEVISPMAIITLQSASFMLSSISGCMNFPDALNK